MLTSPRKECVEEHQKEGQKGIPIAQELRPSQEPSQADSHILRENAYEKARPDDTFDIFRMLGQAVCTYRRPFDRRFVGKKEEYIRLLQCGTFPGALEEQLEPTSFAQGRVDTQSGDGRQELWRNSVLQHSLA